MVGGFKPAVDEIVNPSAAASTVAAVVFGPADQTIRKRVASIFQVHAIVVPVHESVGIGGDLDDGTIVHHNRAGTILPAGSGALNQKVVQVHISAVVKMSELPCEGNCGTITHAQRTGSREMK